MLAQLALVLNSVTHESYFFVTFLSMCLIVTCILKDKIIAYHQTRIIFHHNYVFSFFFETKNRDFSFQSFQDLAAQEYGQHSQYL